VTKRLSLNDWDARAVALLGPLAGCWFGGVLPNGDFVRCVGLRINVAKISTRPVPIKGAVNVPHAGAFIKLGEGKTWPEAFKHAKATLKLERAEIDEGR